MRLEVHTTKYSGFGKVFFTLQHFGFRKHTLPWRTGKQNKTWQSTDFEKLCKNGSETAMSSGFQTLFHKLLLVRVVDWFIHTAHSDIHPTPSQTDVITCNNSILKRLFVCSLFSCYFFFYFTWTFRKSQSRNYWSRVLICFLDKQPDVYILFIYLFVCLCVFWPSHFTCTLHLYLNYF